MRGEHTQSTLMLMHMFFVDESGTPAKMTRPNATYFVIGGLVIPEEIWHDLRNKVVGLKVEKKYHGEIKWRFFAPNNNDDDNPMKDWTSDQRDEFRSRVFEIIVSYRSVKLICCVTHCANIYEKADVNTQDDIYFETYKPLTERFQYLLQDLGREVGKKLSGIIIADHRGQKDDNKLRLQHEKLVREDGRNTSTYTNFVETLFFSPSHLSIGIQLADMVAGATWRAFERGDETHLDKIKGSFRSSPQGNIHGFGLVRVPKS